MAKKPSRMSLLLDAIGGEENLPPKLQEPTTHSKKAPAPTPTPESPASTPSTNEWWNNLSTSDRSLPDVSELRISPSAKVVAIPDCLKDIRRGDRAPPGVNFCPFLAAVRFCYKFVGPDWKQPLATAIFDRGKVYQRGWDVYYIWSGYYPTDKPTTFVPEFQLQSLIDDINDHFPALNITITDELREEGILINFANIRAEMRPRYLGRCTSKEQYDQILTSLSQPSPHKNPESTDPDLAALRTKMTSAVNISRNSKSLQHRLAQHNQPSTHQPDWTSQLQQAQQYFGLTPASSDSEERNEPVLISIDVEKFERAPHQITEVGVATLDTRKLRGTAPGLVAKDWHQFVRARHFRVAEHRHLVNHTFVHGCPDAFRFGTSEVVKRAELAKVLTSCLHEPFSAGEGTGGGGGEGGEEVRQLVLVGHDVQGDVRDLESVGFNVFNRGNLNDTLDTAALFRTYSGEANPRSLANVLNAFGLVCFNFHNAGNDAVYTLWGLMALVKNCADGRSLKNAEQDVWETS